MTSFLILAFMSFFIIKHFVVDFLLQPPYMWKNKGTYGHPGGLLHAGFHSVVSFAFLAIFNPWMALIVSIGEFVVHYHMDWFKMWYNAKKGWGANTHEEFWYFLGFDQLVHYLTYIVMIGMMIQ